MPTPKDTTRAAPKPWRELQSISLPKIMQHLRVDARGLPIPFITDDGSDKPDFRVLNQEKWKQCVIGRQCAITGLPLGTELAFVGGPLCMTNRYFNDPAMLPEAAEYALQVCPFLAAPSFAYADAVKVGQGQSVVNIGKLMSDTRPERFGMGLTGSYRLEVVSGHTLIRAAMFRSIRYWKHGSEITELSWRKEN